MKTLSIVLIYFVLGITSHQTYAQVEVAKELQHLFAAYSGDKNLSFDAHYKYFPDLVAKKATDSMTSKTVLNGKSYYFKIGDYEFIGDESFSIFTDYVNKQIVLGELNENETKKRRLGFIQNLIESSGAEITSFAPGNNTRGLILEYNHQQISRVEIIYNANTYLISKCIIRYLENTDTKTGRPVYSRLEINYSNFESTTGDLPLHYSIQKILQYDKKNVSVGAQYKNYEFVNLTHLKTS